MDSVKKVHKLLFGFPIVCVYGNEGDFSRYKLLRVLTDVFQGNELLINKYIKDKCNVLVYPVAFYEGIFAIKNEQIVLLNSLKDIKLDQYDWIYISSGHCGENIYFFPFEMDENPFPNVKEIVFVESFPFGKREFCDYVVEYIGSHSFVCHKKVVLVDEGRQYGATDIADENSGLESVYTSLNDYVDEICTLSNNKWDADRIDLQKQYLKKKRVVLAKCCKAFDFEKEHYDEYEFNKQYRLCNEERKGLLTDYAFEYISDFQNVKGSSDIEQTMLDNLIKYIEEHKKDIYDLIEALYVTFLSDLKDINDEQVNRIYDNYRKMIENEYAGENKRKCPASKLDYRVLCSDSQYVIKLRKHLEDMTDKYLRDTLYRLIENELSECRERYYEKTEI